MRNRDRRRFIGFDVEGLAWDQLVLVLRYIDDIILISRLLCMNCLAQIVEIVYSVPFEYDVKACPPGGVDVWTDLVVARHTLFVTLKDRTIALPKQFGSGMLVLRSVIMGLVQRLAEVPIRFSSKAKTLVDFVSSLPDKGILKTTLKQAVFGAKKHQPVNLIAALRQIVTKVCKECTFNWRFLSWISVL